MHLLLCFLDPINYSRWGPVYLVDMKSLPEIYAEFRSRNVVKQCNNLFNQVPVDQATG